MEINNLRKLIKELVEEELEELSTSDNAGEYMSKNAFGGSKAAKDKQRSIANQVGYKLVDEKLDDAQKAGTEEVETVPFGKKGAGAMKKPNADGKPEMMGETRMAKLLKLDEL